MLVLSRALVYNYRGITWLDLLNASAEKSQTLLSMGTGKFRSDLVGAIFVA
jgi:hypothetical protein